MEGLRAKLRYDLKISFMKGMKSERSVIRMKL